MSTITVKLVKGLAGVKKIHLVVLESLGLNKTGAVTVQPDNAATRGKISKVIHMIEISK